MECVREDRPSHQASVAPQPVPLARELRTRDGFSIVAGSVIGSGIFLVPSSIAQQLLSFRSVLAVWIVGGALSVFGALSLAELASMFPSAGGLYTYLREAYGNAVAFLYGWGLLFMIHSGSIATLASGCALYISSILPISPAEQRLVAVASIVVLTAANLMSVRHAKNIQNAGMAAKFLGLAALATVLLTKGHATMVRSSWRVPERGGWAAYGIALIAVLWAYEGWHAVSFTAGEFRNPQRDLPRSLLGGMLFVVSVYLLLNIGYYAVITPAEIAATSSRAVASVQVACGAAAVRGVSILIVICILVATNGMILTGPRVYYAMARDGIFFPSLGRINARSRVPARSLLVQGAWASILVLTGSFQQLFTSVIFTAWIFYGLVVIAVIVLRVKQPQTPRRFHVPGYPVLPILFAVAAAAVVVSTIVSSPIRAAAGVGVLLLGVPFYVYFRFAAKRLPAIST
jgi:APA family basic amino acid/polyamine antiporter